MSHKSKSSENHRLAVIAWGLLFIWWGLVIIIEPFTLGIGAVGTGLILLGVNGVRALRDIPITNNNLEVGTLMVIWGALDHARYLLGLSPWLSFALLLFVIGLDLLFTPLISSFRQRVENTSRDV